MEREDGLDLTGCDASMIAWVTQREHVADRREKGESPQPSRPRILLVAPQPFFSLRGTPLNVLQMLRVLCAAGYEVHLATYPMGETIPIAGLVYHRAARLPGVRTVPIGFSPAKLACDLTLAVLVWRLLLQYRFSLVHAVEEAIFFTMPVARMRRVPVIYDLDSVISQQLAYSRAVQNRALLSLARVVERAALRRSALALTVCESLSDEVRALDRAVPIAQIEDCPLVESLRPADPDTVKALRERYGLDDKRVVLYMGNLEAYQGIDLLLSGWPQVHARHPDARLLIVGGTADQIEAARATLGNSGAAGSVILSGAQPANLIPDFMALADVLVSPRRAGENTPLKLYSYMYAGVPIVATDLKTHRQVLDASCALFCAPAPAALGSAIGAVLADRDSFQHLGACARSRVLERYAPNEFARKLLAAYENVLTRASLRAPAA